MKLASIAQSVQLSDGQMHLLKAEGDSTLQGFESQYSFKSDMVMKVPEQTLISRISWLKRNDSK